MPAPGLARSEPLAEVASAAQTLGGFGASGGVREVGGKFGWVFFFLYFFFFTQKC